MKTKNSQILSRGIKSIFIRNLFCLNSKNNLNNLFNPSITIHGGIKDTSTNELTNIKLFEGKTVTLTCNPSWNALDFDCDAFLREPNLTDLHIQVYNTKKFESKETELIYEINIDLKRMVWLPNFEITSISSLPLNSIFFLIEEGGVMFDEKLYILLRSSGLISVGIKQNRIEINDDDENDPQIEEQNRVKTSLQNIITHKLTTLSNLQEKTQEQLSTQSLSYTTNQLQQISKIKLFKLKLELLLEEKLLQYELNEEESENEHINELTNKIHETVTECNACQQSIDNMNEIIEEKKDELLKTKFILEARQLKLLGELGSTIYPIEPVPAPNGSNNERNTISTFSSAPEEYMIRGIELPMIIDTSLKDDEQISTALGYVVHLLSLASKYLQVPLRYEVIYNSSRSMIRDPVVGRGGALPLYKRGVERDRFDRALQWLQKDIEQLMMIRSGAPYDKKKSMLANLKQIFSCEECLKMIS